MDIQVKSMERKSHLSNPDRPILSICVPTFSRADRLKTTLESLRCTQELPVEIVVSDNASPDHTEEVVRGMMEQWPGLKYARQTENVGLMGNYAATFRLASGEFTVFLADDDLIDFDPLWEIVQYLQAHPDIVACLAGWYIWDDHQKKASNKFNDIRELRTFDRSQLGSLFQFTVQHHIFPEVGVFRTRLANKVRFPTRRTWAFHWWMWNHLRHGKICFHPNIFYKNVAVFSDGLPNRSHAGNKLCTEIVDQYRAAAESVLLGAMIEHADLPVPEEFRLQALAAVNSFANSRIIVAARIALAQGDYIASYEYYSRYLLWSPVEKATIVEIENQLIPNAALQALIEVFEQTPQTAEIAICEFANPDPILQGFRSLQRDLPVQVRQREEVVQDRAANRVIVVERPDSVEHYVAAGILPGLVYSMQDTIQCFRLLPRKG